MPAIDPVKLNDLIVDLFTVDELNDLMFRLRINEQIVKGSTIDVRARELVRLCSRLGTLEELLQLCVAKRPDADWSAVEVAVLEGGKAAIADPQRAEALAELRRFKALLDEGRQTYLRHNAQRGRLWLMIHQNHPNDIPPYNGYDDLFYKMYDRLSDEEMELFKIVRGNTRVGTHRINGRIRDWAESHDIRAMFPEATPAVLALERELMELRVHLSEWFAKYEETFLPDPKRTLVYLGDEKKQGTEWPQRLDGAVAAVLAER